MSVLHEQSGKTGVGLDGFGSLVLLVGGTPVEGLEALHLAGFVGQVLSELVESGGLLGVGLGLYAQELAAVVGTEVILLAVNGEGGKIGSAHVVAEGGLDVIVCPGTGHNDGGAGSELGSLRGAQMSGGLDELLHTLYGDEAVVGIEGIVDFGELTVVIGDPLGLTAGRKEEGSEIPGGSLHFESEILAGVLTVLDQLLHGVEVGLGDNGLIIVHEVAVIGGEGVGVEIFARGSGGNDAFVVGFLNGLGSAGAELGKSRGLDEPCELVLSEEVDIAAGLNVGDHVGSRVSLGSGLDLRGELDAEFVVGVEVVDLLLGEIDSRLGYPNGDLVLTGNVAGLVAGLIAAGLLTSRKSEDHDENQHDA